MIRALAFALILPFGAHAQTDAGSEARAASAALVAAAAQLDEAKGARDRVKALTQTIQAFERGLGAMRAGLRQAAISEAQLTQKLSARDVELAELCLLYTSPSPRD